MKHTITLSLLLLMNIVLQAQQNIHFHTSGTTQTYQINEGDSLYFDETHTTIYFFNQGSIIENRLDNLDSISFSDVVDANVYIEFQETSVHIVNPLADSGVNITHEGGRVTIYSTSSLEEINYICSGTSSDGMLKIYSDKKFNLLLDNLDLYNPTGPAINIQSEKRAFVNVLAGTSNVLKDGLVYNEPVMVNGEEEDQKATFFSEGKLDFIGSGSLVVNAKGEDQHGIRSDKALTLYEGNITIASSEKDGIHADGFFMEGGNLSINSLGDGIDADADEIEINCGTIVINSVSDDVKGISSEGTMTINGGEITLNISGAQSKGLKCDTTMLLNGGTIHGIAAGNAVLETEGLGYDPSYCSLIKADGDLFLNGTSLDFKTTGQASRGISCDKNLTIQSGNITIISSGNGAKYTNADGQSDAYHGACLKVDGNLLVLGGDITLTNSGSGGKGISANGDITLGDGSNQPQLKITTTGQSITITQGGSGPGGSSGDYDEAKAMKSDGSITINSGSLQVSSADDGMKADGTITFNQGQVNILKSVEGVEAPNIVVNDGQIHIYSSDDGFNATKGNGGEQNDGSLLKINGGYCYLNSTAGDPMDSNGSIDITGGTVVVHGPQSSPEVGLDVNGNATISGGFVIISGTNSNMTEGFASSSSQKSLIIKSSQSISANTLIHLEDANGKNLFTFKPVRTYYSIVFSSPDLISGSGYKLYTSGTSTGTESDGLYSGGAYASGTLKKTFNITSTVTTVSF